MSEIKNGGTAFPATERNIMHEMPGMTLRDYFAAKAIQGMLSDNYSLSGSSLCKTDAKEIACDAYMIADAMLEARQA